MCAEAELLTVRPSLSPGHGAALPGGRLMALVVIPTRFSHFLCSNPHDLLCLIQTVFVYLCLCIWIALVVIPTRFFTFSHFISPWFIMFCKYKYKYKYKCKYKYIPTRFSHFLISNPHYLLCFANTNANTNTNTNACSCNSNPIFTFSHFKSPWFIMFCKYKWKYKYKYKCV